MKQAALWMWHYGEYEIYHGMMANLRREEREYHRPPFWRVSVPYASVRFFKEIVSDGGYLLASFKGSGCVEVNGKRYPAGKRIELSAGKNTVWIFVSNAHGLPAAYVESDVCPSDGTWRSSPFAGEMTPVGTHPYFDAPEKDPQIFPFSYERRRPATRERVEDGILFDFGTELFGYLNLRGATPEEEIGVYYGESREEALDTAHSYLIDSVSGKRDYRLHQRAFRYVYLTGAVADVTLDADYEYLPLTAHGRFACSDPLMERICHVAAYTFHLNCRETYFDGIKRDRWTWSGDAYQSARINAYLFSDKEIDQRTLLTLIGKEPIDQHINTILDYSLLWLIGLWEHYLHYGDLAFIRRILPRAQRLLAFCETRKNADGMIEGIGDDWTFIDWAPMDKTGAIASEQMLMIEAYRAVARLREALGMDSARENEQADALLRRVNERYWDREKGAFIDSYTSGKRNVTRHANIFAVMYGIATKAQTESILNNVLRNGAIPPITTPYFKGYELDVLGLTGEYAAIEREISSYYGGMLDLGAVTLWEEYDPRKHGIEHYAMYSGKYEKSLCHAWGASPIYIFGRYYLGVTPTEAGYRHFRVAPALGSFSHVKGCVPINGGTVTVEADTHGVRVTATRAGGTLHWKGADYAIPENEPLIIMA